MESENIQLSFEQVSAENNWAIFAVETSDNQYGEQLLFLKENRLYMLQYSGDSPQTLTLEQKNDFRFIKQGGGAKMCHFQMTVINSLMATLATFRSYKTISRSMCRNYWGRGILTAIDKNCHHQ